MPSFDLIYERVMKKLLVEDTTDAITAVHDKVVIDPDALEKVKADLVAKKGQPYFNQLKVLAQGKRLLTVSAIKRVNKTSGNMTDAASGTFTEEADVVQQFNPGSYHSPMSVPLCVLKKVSDYNGSFNIPLDSDTDGSKKNTAGKYDDAYDKGVQPKGTRTKGGNN